MRKAYPVILRPSKVGYYVSVPDLNIGTQGDNLAEALYMARDAINMWAISAQDMGQKVPEPSSSLPPGESGDLVMCVDVDFDIYRKEADITSERTNVSIPRNLKYKAKAAGLNLSQELQTRLREVLKVA